jgi:hypothetical protein
MKLMINILKSILLITFTLMTTIIPVSAMEQNKQNLAIGIITYADNYVIEAKYNNETYIFERSEDDTDQWNKGDTIILDLNNPNIHEALNGQYNGTVVQIYPDKNLVIVKVDNDIYSFCDTENYYKVNDNVVLTFQDDEVINAKLV